MSGKLRHDTTCQNCGYTVDRNFCSECGQKNTETRQSFGHLFGHFVEDLTHYDTAFWKTIKYLLFHPARLTKEYLAGHRMRFVPPVKLYIFISFVTFLLLAVLPSDTDLEDAQTMEFRGTLRKNGLEIDGTLYHSVAQYDSLHNPENPTTKKLSRIKYWTGKAAVNAFENGVSYKEFGEAFIHTLPKVLFIYMPIFAFFLWLLHGKKRWMFFDHGIFTLHYFSFMLLLFSIVYLIGWVTDELLIADISEPVITILGLSYSAYLIIYFFVAHGRMYGEKKWISWLKGIFFFIVNSMIVVVLMLFSLLYILLNIH